jgi:hypothetical protein
MKSIYRFFKLLLAFTILAFFWIMILIIFSGTTDIYGEIRVYGFMFWLASSGFVLFLELNDNAI